MEDGERREGRGGQQCLSREEQTVTTKKKMEKATTNMKPIDPIKPAPISTVEGH